LMGVSALRSGKTEEAVPLLAEAELKLPLTADYALLYQAEALLKLKKYAEASAKAGSFAKTYPSSLLVRRADKLYLDIFFSAGDYKGALKIAQAFVEKYSSGSDSVDALFLSARCREETNDPAGAGLIYRSIWLNNPLAPQAKKAQERLKELEKGAGPVAVFTAEELLRRASSLYTQNEFALSLQTLQSIPPDGQLAAVTGRIDLRSGLAQYRQRNWKAAEKTLAKASVSTLVAIRSEARFWQAKSLERLDQNERAFALYMELAGEGPKQEFADDALMEAAGLRRSLGSYAEAARLYEQVLQMSPDFKFIPRASWEAAWCHYLAGEYAVAATAFKALLKDENVREKTLYWLARALENSGSSEAGDYFSALLNEYPAGFYATWHREQKGIKDLREGLDHRFILIDAQVPAGFDKPRLLASLGMLEEARNEAAAVRKKMGDKKGQFPGLARLYLEMGDYGSAIALFLQNRPVKWEKGVLPLWTAGYPLVYSEHVAKHTDANNLSEALIYALIRAESGFSPAVKSPAGAIGLMQLMPATAKNTAREKGSFNVARLTTPEYNIMLGTRHFHDLLKEYNGDVVYSIAAYNAGAFAVERWRKNLKGLKKDEFIESIPYQETRDYVKKVYASAAIYRQLYGLR
jgi:soluble lytic murein transglycosylase